MESKSRLGDVRLIVAGDAACLEFGPVVILGATYSGTVSLRRAESSWEVETSLVFRDGRHQAYPRLVRLAIERRALAQATALL